MKYRIEEYTNYYTGNHLSSTQLVTDGTGVAIQQVEYAPFGEVVNEYNIDWSNGQVPDFKFNGKELDEENGMYYFEARYQSPPVFISRDVLFEEKPWMSPYSYCRNNPLNMIDPSGNNEDWYENANGEVVWDDKVTSQANTPDGGTYIGKNDNDILTHYGFDNYNPDVQSSNKIGYVAVSGDQQSTSHLINVQSKSELSITPLVQTGQNISENNKDGKVFNGIMFSVINSAFNTGSSEGDVQSNATMNLTYGNTQISAPLLTPNGLSLGQAGKTYRQANITLLPSMLTTDNNTKTRYVSIKGNWNVCTAGGNTPVVLHPLLPIPKSFNHQWDFWVPERYNKLFNIRR
jgi:RHS repeat-associated protein